MTCNTPICARHCSEDYCAEADAIGSYHVALEALREEDAAIHEEIECWLVSALTP
jgi:hypothetical protein